MTESVILAPGGRLDWKRMQRDQGENLSLNLCKGEKDDSGIKSNVGIGF